MSEIEELKKQLEDAREANVLAIGMMGGYALLDERPTGKTVTVMRCTNPTQRDAKKQKFVDVTLPTYHLRVNIPKGAGLCLTTNGVEYYHGESYVVDRDTLVDLKSRQARAWENERLINGKNENEYRKPTGVTL